MQQLIMGEAGHELPHRGGRYGIGQVLGATQGIQAGDGGRSKELHKVQVGDTVWRMPIVYFTIQCTVYPQHHVKPPL